MTDKQLDTQLREAAGEYVLGVLQGQERIEFEQDMVRNHELQAEVTAWEERLSPMLELVEPVSPPPGVWDQIQQRVEGETAVIEKTSIWDSLAFWRNLGMITAGLVLVMGLTLIGVNREPDLNKVMMVTGGPEAQVQWVVGTAGQTDMLQIKAVAAPEMPAGQVCQLWMENPDGTLKPVGILPHTGSQSMRMPATLMPNSRFKISIEKADSLPTDKPTNKFIFEGGLIKI